MNIIWILLGLLGGACILLMVNHDAGSTFGIENEKFASMVWLTLWGAVVGAAILPRQGGLRSAARNLTIWIAIIALLMAGYVYRYELQDIASRISGGIVPGSPIVATDSDGRSTTMLIGSPNGQFSARGQVNGSNVNFLVDTGANVVVLTQQDARAADIDPDELQYSVPVTTANGRTTAARIRIDSLIVGEIERRQVPALVARAGALETSLLGMSFLSTLSSFEFRGDRLVLTD